MKSMAFASMMFVLSLSTAWGVSEKDLTTQYQATVGSFYATGDIGEFEGVGGATIKYRVFEVPNARGAVVIVNGRTESYAKYAEVIYDLAHAGYSIYVFDHRGQGYSSRLVKNPRVGYVRRFNDYVQDLHSFMTTVVGSQLHSRRFLLAHSMGGAIAALYLEAHPTDFNAAVFSSPMLEINTAPYPEWAALAIADVACAFGLSKHYAPGQSDSDIDGTFATNRLTHSRIRYDLAANLIRTTPEAGLGGVSNRWIQQSLLATRKAVRHASRVTTPILLLQAGADQIVRPGGQNRFCSHARHCELVGIPGAYHELLMETDELRAPVVQRMVEFLDKY